MVVVVRAPVGKEPLAPWSPDQPPEATQVTALVVVQLIVELPPFATVLGLADKETVGAVAALTLTVTDWVADPPSPEQVRT